MITIGLGKNDLFLSMPREVKYENTIFARMFGRFSVGRDDRRL
jgi:hypothetical protein